MLQMHYSFLNEWYICRLGALSLPRDLSALRPATALTSCTDVFTLMWMTISACIPTAAVAKMWTSLRDGSGQSSSCVGGAALSLRGHGCCHFTVANIKKTYSVNLSLHRHLKFLYHMAGPTLTSGFLVQGGGTGAI